MQVRKWRRTRELFFIALLLQTKDAFLVHSEATLPTTLALEMPVSFQQGMVECSTPPFISTSGLGLRLLVICGTSINPCHLTVCRCGGVPKSPRTKNSTYLRQIKEVSMGVLSREKKILITPPSMAFIWRSKGEQLKDSESGPTQWDSRTLLNSEGRWDGQDTRNPRSDIVPDTQLHSTTDCWVQQTDHLIHLDKLLKHSMIE